MSENITVIVGAGAVLDFKHYGIFPSSKNITEEVLKLSVQTVDGKRRLIIKEIYEYVVNRLKEVGNPESRRLLSPELNFEDMLQILEMCYTYSSCWHNEYLSWKSVPFFGILIEPSSFLKDINTIEYLRAAYALQEKVMEIVYQYDSFFTKSLCSELWYRNFWKSFNGHANVFTLNYDTTIEQSLGRYEDGYLFVESGIDYSRFSAKKYYDNRDNLSTIAHLHGEILFSEARDFPFDYSIRDMVKNRNYESAYRNRKCQQCPPENQAKEIYIQPYIVSGTRKIEKLTFIPNSIYLSDLSNKIINNKKLIVIGYSFGDTYLNELLCLGIDAHKDDFRVAIIDKFPEYINSYPSFYNYIRNKCNHGQYSFISRLCGDGMHIEIGQKDFPVSFFDKNSIASKNGRLIILPNGFKETVEHQWQFLNEFFKT